MNSCAAGAEKPVLDVTNAAPAAMQSLASTNDLLVIKRAALGITLRRRLGTSGLNMT